MLTPCLCVVLSLNLCVMSLCDVTMCDIVMSVCDIIAVSVGDIVTVYM